MEIGQTLIDDIVRRVLSVSDAERIILFGSAATGRMSRDSDIDLLVLGPDSVDTDERWLRIRRALSGIDYPVDIVLMPTVKFEESKNVVGGIAFPANKYGRVIYEAA